eukprot:Clim_evm66s33 gene=Clim_evmTU66s33
MAGLSVLKTVPVGAVATFAGFTGIAVVAYMKQAFDPRISWPMRVTETFTFPLKLFLSNAYFWAPGPYSRWLDPPELPETPAVMIDPDLSLVALSPDGVASRDFDTGVNGNKARLFIPPKALTEVGEGGVSAGSATRRDVLLFFHGGGFIHFSRATGIYDGLCRRMAKEFDMLVVSMDYRTAPEHKYPAALEDGLATTRWIFEGKDIVRELQRFGADHQNRGIYLSGQSAGGVMINAVMAMTYERQLQDIIKVRGMWLQYAFFFGANRLKSEDEWGNRTVILREKYSAWIIAQFYPQAKGHGINFTAKYLDPRTVDDAIIAQFPPTISTHGEMDLFKDRAMHYAAHQAELGVTTKAKMYPSEAHGYVNNPTIPQSAIHLRDSIQWMIEHARDPAGTN